MILHAQFSLYCTCYRTEKRVLYFEIVNRQVFVKITQGIIERQVKLYKNARSTGNVLKRARGRQAHTTLRGARMLFNGEKKRLMIFLCENNVSRFSTRRILALDGSAKVIVSKTHK